MPHARPLAAAFELPTDFIGKYQSKAYKSEIEHLNSEIENLTLVPDKSKIYFLKCLQVM